LENIPINIRRIPSNAMSIRAIPVIAELIPERNHIIERICTPSLELARKSQCHDLRSEEWGSECQCTGHCRNKHIEGVSEAMKRPERNVKGSDGNAEEKAKSE
jgi:hypothetical protein